MSEYRNKTTGEVKTQGEWRSAFPNTSLPKVWKAATLEGLNLEPVMAAPIPKLNTYQVLRRNGVVQDANKNWIENWETADMFSDNSEGTKAEQEAAYQSNLDAAVASSHRQTRNTLLAETDWSALKDVTLSNSMKNYRQALRDITSHSNFPNLENADWPTKP
jgi:hypothetical protein